MKSLYLSRSAQYRRYTCTILPQVRRKISRLNKQNINYYKYIKVQQLFPIVYYFINHYYYNITIINIQAHSLMYRGYRPMATARFILFIYSFFIIYFFTRLIIIKIIIVISSDLSGVYYTIHTIIVMKSDKIKSVCLHNVLY